MRSVKVILSEDVPNLGDAGELVAVKPGFARNYLLPLGKAIAATEASVNELEHQKRVIAEKVARQRKLLEGEKAKFEGQVVEITAQAGEEGKLFGSVTAAMIADKLAERGLEVDKRKVALADPIKDVGEHPVVLKLHREIQATITVKVTAAP
jgi:large subunit ribosomal protein L9